MNRFVTGFVTWGGLGRMAWAPGTWGSLGALPLVFLARELPFLAEVCLLLFFVLASTLIVERYERHVGSHDLSHIVVDEVAGMWISLLAIPLSLWSVAIGFVLFRTLDILKPFPLSFLDRRVQGGLGVMADDLVAGILVNVALHFLVGMQLLVL